ncbi:ras association domain-containing protein 5 [Austrofundulus limnaeus]|uniref:Ras association domain-containing protein 5 n=1 Tax=Austrofundulus limnaeus TaxID=52670 RepID=A0A2I4C135_AUSLI|nr:PREDICTED: ras association domain-containing protein 5-like [Austrofundulus limnaeus]
MFNPSPPSRKHAPSVTDGCEFAPEPLHVSDTTWPPPGAKMRISKGAVVVRGVRRQPSAGSLESLEAVWGQREQPDVAPRSPGAREAARNGIEGHGGAPPRARKSRFRAPDVRTIFSPGEKDPRVKEESGEGHTFQVVGESAWCDFCCQYIFQDVLTCSGCKYACHAECRDKVSLDCHPATSPISQDQLNNNTPLHTERPLRDNDVDPFGSSQPPDVLTSLVIHSQATASPNDSEEKPVTRVTSTTPEVSAAP